MPTPYDPTKPDRGQDLLYRSPSGKYDEGWSIETDVVNDGTCSHAIDGVVPYAVVSLNEAGYNDTRVCLQCIIEKAKELSPGRFPI